MNKIYQPEDCIWQRGERVVFNARIPREAHCGVAVLPGDAGTVLGAMATIRPMIVWVELDEERDFGKVIKVAETRLEAEPGPV